MTTRIALLVDSPSQRAHGNAVSRLALGLVNTGLADVDLVTYSDDPAPPWLPAEVEVRRLGVDRVSRAIPPLTRYLRDRRPDTFVTRMVHANLVALLASSLARAPHGWGGSLVLVQDHPIALSHASNRKDNKWAAKLLYRFADGVVCPSPEVRDDIISWCGLDPSAVGLVPNAIPAATGTRPPAPHPWLRQGQPPVFVNTSNMSHWKRLDLLIDAFALVRRKHHVRLLIMGEGPARSAAARQVGQLGLAEDIQLVGWVDDPMAYAAHAWAFVLPSDEEGFAQVLTEAMSVGCPVISTDAQGGGPRFVTEDGTFGLLVGRGDRHALATAMEQVLQPQVRARYAGLGVQRVEAFSPEACAHALSGFLDDRMDVTR